MFLGLNNQHYLDQSVTDHNGGHYLGFCHYRICHYFGTYRTSSLIIQQKNAQKKFESHSEERPNVFPADHPKPKITALSV